MRIRHATHTSWPPGGLCPKLSFLWSCLTSTSLQQLEPHVQHARAAVIPTYVVQRLNGSRTPLPVHLIALHKMTGSGHSSHRIPSIRPDLGNILSSPSTTRSWLDNRPHEVASNRSVPARKRIANPPLYFKFAGATESWNEHCRMFTTMRIFFRTSFTMESRLLTAWSSYCQLLRSPFLYAAQTSMIHLRCIPVYRYVG